jgi:hypothetical protein
VLGEIVSIVRVIFLILTRQDKEKNHKEIGIKRAFRRSKKVSSRCSQKKEVFCGLKNIAVIGW